MSRMRFGRGFTARAVGVADSGRGAWVWLTAAALCCGMAGTAWGQASIVPEKIDPRPAPAAPTLPPGAGGDRELTTPRSETPLAPTDGARPVPDGGVLVPPSTGSTPVIQPPAMGAGGSPMPVIPPPGSPGGDPTIIPK